MQLSIWKHEITISQLLLFSNTSICIDEYFGINHLNILFNLHSRYKYIWKLQLYLSSSNSAYITVNYNVQNFKMHQMSFLGVNQLNILFYLHSFFTCFPVNPFYLLLCKPVTCITCILPTPVFHVEISKHIIVFYSYTDIKCFFKFLVTKVRYFSSVIFINLCECCSYTIQNMRVSMSLLNDSRGWMGSMLSFGNLSTKT